jgi:hypothetical protein
MENDPVEKAQFKVIFDFQEHHYVMDVHTMLENIMSYCIIFQDDPHDRESRCENLRRKHEIE